MLLDQKEIAALIPHGEGMSLLDSVEFWDEKSIRCRTASHNRESNPLRDCTNLDSYLLIEYGAQAAAVHAGLIRSQLGSVSAAYLGAVKSLNLLSDTVPLVDELVVEAKPAVQSEGGAIYCFSVTAGDSLLAEGRLTLVQPA